VSHTQFAFKYIKQEKQKKATDMKTKVNCRLLKLRRVNGQKREKEQNLEDGEKSGLMQISQGKESIQPVSMR
jgi:hypothetical protein